jgi:uncharacterized damage-inducible protein DinB
MESIESFRRLFEYDRWANHATLASLKTVTGSTERSLKVFNHILGGQRVWLARFDNPNPPNVQPWPALGLEECGAAIDDAHKRWMALLDQLTPEKLSQDLTYRTMAGAEFKTPIRDVITHMVMHSAYHRGQVAAAVREDGGKPTPTDYVVYLRQKN